MPRTPHGPMIALIGCVALSVACGDTTAPLVQEQEPLASQLASVDMETEALVDGMLDLELSDMTAASGGGSGTITTDVTFSRSRPCPAGGELAVQGEIHRTLDLDSGVMEATSEGTRSRTDCAFVRHELTITVNGSSTWEAFRRRVHGRPDGPQTSSHEGSFHAVRSDGEERSCEFSIEVVRDPQARTRTVSGSICGTRFHREVTWSHGG